MNFWIVVLLCVVQGLTEFLPVSSSGHLTFFEQVFNLEGNMLLLNLFLHLATLLAVIVLYRKIIWKLIKKPFQPLTYKLIISTLMTLIFAFSYEIFDIDRFVPNIYGFCFLITAAILFSAHWFQKKAVVLKHGEISYKHAILVGVVQGLAVLPGISRSGSTISALLICGNDEAECAEYSFLLSVPIIIGGFIFELIKVDSFDLVFNSISPLMCVFAFILTFVVSIISLKITLKMLKNKKFIFFAIYLIFIGILAIILSFI